MKRIILMIFRNLFYAPVMWIRLNWYVKHKEKYSEDQIYALLRDIVVHAVRGGNVEVRSYGVENIPAENGFIMYPNHQGLFDILAVLDTCPNNFRIIGKAELTNTPLIKQVFALTDSYYIDREDLRQSMEVIKNVTKDVKEGRNFVIFPEGARSKQGNSLLEFKGGSFKAAQKAGCPIVPVAIADSYKVMDTNSTKRVTVKIAYLPPLLASDYQGMKTTEIAEEVRSRIIQKIQEMTGEDA